MNYRLAFANFFLITVNVTVFASDAPERGFVSSKAASTWEQALISGNGKYGALVTGQPLEETVVLNHARLFMPLNAPLPPVNTADHRNELRDLMAQGRYQRAADEVVELSRKEGYGAKRWTDPFIPAFDLKVKMTEKGEIRDYRRSVDFRTGVVAVSWADDRGAFCRRLFVSRPDDVVVLSITGPRASVDCDLWLAQRPTKNVGGWGPEEMFKLGIKETSTAADDNWLTYRSGFRRTWRGSLQGYEGASRVAVRGGTTSAESGRISIRGADEVLALTRIELLKDYSVSRIPEIKRQLTAVEVDYDALLDRHAKVHGAIFNRMKLDLGGAADRDLTSEELIAKSRVGALSKALLEKEFDAGRYAIISSSGELFPNLQGIWNGTWAPPWSSDFTMNGNVQCAIAADLSGNMPEMLEPYFRYLESQMPDYRENARRLYGCRGIHVPSRTSSHGLNNHFDGTWPMTFWTAGAGWASQFFYDYYLYTGDREFLEKRALPFMKEAALFYEDFLIEGPDGKYLFSPSYSPENNPKNNRSQACINATMDIAVAKELLGNLAAACETLQTDPDGIRRWKAMLAKMPGYQINADGAIKEWATPLLEDNYAHRHCSHLYALFNVMPAEIASDATLQKAFHRAVERRMEFRRRENGGEMAFGLVQMGFAASSLRDAEISYEVVDWLANNFWGDNLVSTHNPKGLFNTDICGGMPAVIIKMLVESRPGKVFLLPACPKQWPVGTIEGVCCRGQIELQRLSWNPDQITVIFRSDVNQRVAIAVSGVDGEQSVDLSAGRPVTLKLLRK